MAILTRATPGRDFELLRREMDRLFHDFLPARNAQDAESEQAVWAPRADLAETEGTFEIALELPGLRPEDVNITLEEDTLKVSGQRALRQEQREGQFHRIERAYGQFFRAFRFGAPVDANGVEAAFEDGVLHVRVPKSEASKPRRIEVRGGRRAVEADASPSGSEEARQPNGQRAEQPT